MSANGRTIDELAVEISSNATSAVSGIDALISTLERLKRAASGGANLTATVNQLKKLNNAMQTLQVPGQKLAELASALQPLASIGKSNLGSFISQLGKLPQVAAGLSKIDLGQFTVQIRLITTALQPLASVMDRVSAGFAKFPARIQQVVQSNNKLANSNAGATRSFSLLGNGFSGFAIKTFLTTAGLRRISAALGELVSNSNNYVENLNLFTVAMGKGTDSALLYAEKVQDALGIDMSEWIRNQGIFQNMASGFGVFGEKAQIMSQNLTQIAYDYSSMMNEDITMSTEKFRAGLAGELEPLRAWGFALDQATLQQVAYDNGIKQNISTMTQAQKSQLRFIAIMEQSEKAQGDLARTITSPANAMRILEQQITQLKRALGNILIPALTAVLPYIQAFVQILTNAARSIAALAGFKLPVFDYSGLAGLSDGADESTNSLKNAANAAKELKNTLLGFDQLNKMDDPTSGGDTKSSGSNYDLGVDLSAYNYDFFGNTSSQVAELVTKFENGFARVRAAFTTLGSSLRGFCVRYLQPLASDFKGFFNGTLLPIMKNVGTSLISGLSSMFGSYIETYRTMFKAIWASLTMNINWAGLLGEAGVTLTGLSIIFVQAFDTLSTVVKSYLDVIKKLWDDYGAAVLDTVWNYLSGIWDSFNLYLNEYILPIVRNVLSMVRSLWEDHLSGMFNRVGEFVSKLIIAAGQIYQSFIKPVVDFLIINLAPAFRGVWDIIIGIINGTVIVISDAFGGLMRMLSGVIDFLTGVFTGNWRKAWSGIKDIVGGVFDGFRAVFDGLAAMLKAPINIAIDSINRAIRNINNTIKIEIPSWVPGLGGERLSFSIPTIPRMAEGGFPNQGEMFIAREAGPELVGSIGGRTAVANNSQIVEAVSQGVAKAVSGAIHSQSNGGDINIYVDGVLAKTISAAQRKNTRNGRVVIPV